MPKQRPSFLKRQKEQQRKAKADKKREARNARRRGPLDDDVSPRDVERPDIETPAENEGQNLIEP